MSIPFSEHDLLLRYLNKRGIAPSVMVDVGAHHGIVSQKFVALGYQVIAYEPEPSNHAALVKNLGAKKNVTIFQNAVSNRAEEEVSFYRSPDHYGIHSLQPFHESHTEEIKVKTIRLDESLSALGVEKVDCLKIDIEGADFLALQSFDFAKIKPAIVMCEFMDERSQKHFGYTHHEMVDFMRSFGYKTWVSEWAEIEEYGRIDGAGVEHRFLRCVPYPLDHEAAWGNLLFVPEKDATQFANVLASYLAELEKVHRGKQRRRFIESLPMGKQVYHLLKQFRRSKSKQA
jgi:FkbM family methyltransferase